MEKTIKVLMINGSPRAEGNTALALHEMERVFAEQGIQVETVQIGGQAIRGCVACNGCAKLGKCVYDDIVNELAVKFEKADGLVIASPVYYASANATLIACLDRLFYSSGSSGKTGSGASGGTEDPGLPPADQVKFYLCRRPCSLYQRRRPYPWKI